MSNRTNIDLEALYCPTARRESILLSEATADSICAYTRFRGIPFPFPPFFEKLCRNLLTYITPSPRVGGGGEWATPS